MNSFCQRLKTLRLSRGITQETLADRIGVSVISIRSWERGDKKPSMSAIIALSNVFNVSSDFLLGLSSRLGVEPSLLNRQEQRLLNDYRSLDDCGKRVVLSVCKLEAERCVNSVEEKPSASRYIPRFIMPSAAGFAEPFGVDDFELIEAGAAVPNGADFAVKIQGRSMEPTISDGSLVYVHKTSEIRIGEIGIFSVNGAMYCKRYTTNELGDTVLKSDNPEMQQANVVLSMGADDEVKCFGRVLV